MRKLIFYCLFLLATSATAQVYNPATHVVVNKAIGQAQAAPTDARSMYWDGANFIYRPFQNTAEVLTYLPLAKYRTGNFPIFINLTGVLNGNGTFTGGAITEYWFKNGTADSNLVVKTTSGGGGTWGTITGTLSSQTDLQAALDLKQAILVSGTNIKTINGSSVLGSGNLVVSGSSAWGSITGTLSSQTDLQTALNARQATLVSGTNIKTINGSSVLGSGDLVVSGGGGTSNYKVYTNYDTLRAVSSPSTSTIYWVTMNGWVSAFLWNASSTVVDDTAMTIKSTANATGRFERFCPKEVNAIWFGANGTDGSSDSYALQKAINWVLKYKTRGNLLIPGGAYIISRGLFVGIDANSDGQWDFCNINIYGEKRAYGAQGANGAETSFYVTDPTDFGIAFQNNKGSEISNIAFFGTNDAPESVTTLTIADTAHSTWVDADVRDVSTSPNCAIVIDPFCRASAHIGTSWMYPNWIDHYTETFDNGSTDIYLHDLKMEQFTVGICNSPTVVKQNAEIMSYERIWVSNLKSAFTNGQSQARTCIYRDIHGWSGIEVMFDCQRYSDVGASGIYVDGLNCADRVKWIVACEDFGLGGTNVIKNAHCELTYGIGGSLNANVGGSVRLVDSQFDLLGEQNGFSHRANMIFNGLSLVLDHTKIQSYSQGDPNPYFALCKNIVLTNASEGEVLSSGFVTNVGNNYSDFGPSFKQNRITKVGWMDADVALAGTMPLEPGQKFIINNQDVSLGGIGWAVEREYVGSAWVTIPIVIDSTNSRTGTTAILVVNPSSLSSVCLGSILLSNFKNEMTFANSQTGFGYVSAIDLPTKRITVTFANKDVPSNFSGTIFAFKRIKMSTYPYFAIGNIVSGSPKIGGLALEKTTLNVVANEYFCHPAFPYGTWVKSIVGDTITLSNNATYTQSNAFIANSTAWKTTVLGGEPMTALGVSTAGKFAYQRGDEFRNMISNNNSSADSTVGKYIVTKDGMAGLSGRQPVIRPMYNAPDMKGVHNLSVGGSPTSAGLGTNVSSVTITGSDMHMKMVVVTSGAVSGTICNIAFNTAWNSAPIPSAINSYDVTTAGASSAMFMGGVSTTGATFGGNISGAGTYTYSIHWGQ